MSLSIILSIVVGGLLAGFLTGLLGVGGGVVMVPALYQIFLYQGEPTQTAFTAAVATSLVVMIFTGAYAALIHRRNGLLDATLVLWTGAGTTVGAMIGANIMVASDGRLVRLGFGCFYGWWPHLCTCQKLNHVRTIMWRPQNTREGYF